MQQNRFDRDELSSVILKFAIVGLLFLFAAFLQYAESLTL